MFHEYTNTDWMIEGTCSQLRPDGTPVYDSETWFPVGTTGPAIPQTARAVAICNGCPVRARCLAWALENGQDAGIWGGKTEDQRRVIHRRITRHRAARRPAAQESASSAPRPPRFDEVAVARVLAGDPAAIAQVRASRDQREAIAYAMALRGESATTIMDALRINGSTVSTIVERARKDRVA